jgi:hypothetical protein
MVERRPNEPKLCADDREITGIRSAHPQAVCAESVIRDDDIAREDVGWRRAIFPNAGDTQGMHNGRRRLVDVDERILEDILSRFA